MVTAFTTALVLLQCVHASEVIIEIDASGYVSAGVLSQYDDEGFLYPVLYYLRKHTPAKYNYDV